MNNTITFRQSINAKITSNNKKEVSAAKLRMVLTDAADSIDGAILDSNNNAVLAGIYRDEAKYYSQQSSSNREEKGDWNPNTNTPLLSANATVGSSWVPGVSGKPQAYTISAAGTLPFAIKGQAIGSAIDKGYLVQHPNGQWFYDSSSTVALTKINGIELDVKKNILYSDHIYYPVEPTPSSGGLVYKETNRIVIPAGTTSINTFFRKIVPLTDFPDYKGGDKIEAVFIISESVAGSMTAVSPPRITANTWTERAGGAINNPGDADLVERLDATTVRVTRTFTLNALDLKITPGIMATNPGTNTTGVDLAFTLISVSTRNLNDVPQVSVTSDIFRKISKRLESNVESTLNKELSLISISNTLDASASNGATKNGGQVTVPIGQHGNNSFSVLRFPISRSPYFSKMIGKNVVFEYVAKTSTDLSNIRNLRLQTNATTGGVVIGDQAVNPTITVIDSTHIKLRFEFIVKINDTQLDTYVQFADTRTAAAIQTLELQNKLYFRWQDNDEKNSNNRMLEIIAGEISKGVFEGTGIVWSGTSIPEGHKPNSYPEQIGRKLGAVMYNTAIGGSKILFNGGTPGMSGTIAELSALTPPTPEHSYENTIMKYLASPYFAKTVVLDHAFNDANFTPANLGNINSTSKSTFYGAYDFVIKAILNTYPDVRIIIATCPNRYPFGDTTGIANHESLRTAQKEIASKWGFYLLDFGGNMGFNQITSVAGKKTTDGVHQTLAETDRMANYGHRCLITLS